MKALRPVGQTLRIALFIATVTRRAGLPMVPLTLRPLTALCRLLPRLALADKVAAACYGCGVTERITGPMRTAVPGVAARKIKG